MKKSKKWIIAMICIAVCSVMIMVWNCGRRPFKNLKPSEIVSATVRLTPPDKTIRIEDPHELTDYLHDVTIYHQDNSNDVYAGQAVTFMLTRSDGTQTQITVCEPLLIVDGVGYKTKYEPCEALSNYANRLLHASQDVDT